MSGIQGLPPSVHPPPCPFSDLTYPSLRSPAMIRRITAGLVRIDFASASPRRTLQVLVEGPSRTDPARLRGRSRHNKVVNFDGLGAPGDFVDVEITAATSQTLSGEASLLARAAG